MCVRDRERGRGRGYDKISLLWEKKPCGLNSLGNWVKYIQKKLNIKMNKLSYGWARSQEMWVLILALSLISYLPLDIIIKAIYSESTLKFTKYFSICWLIWKGGKDSYFPLLFKVEEMSPGVDKQLEHGYSQLIWIRICVRNRNGSISGTYTIHFYNSFQTQRQVLLC